MSATLIIAELGSSWRFGSDHLANAERMIREAKSCGADVAKFQWTSDAKAMAARRGLGLDAATMYERYLQFDKDWLTALKASCDLHGMEFMCTVYLPQDIPVIAPLVKRMKVSAFESKDSAPKSFVEECYATGKKVVISINPDACQPRRIPHISYFLHCVSKYPTPLEEAQQNKLADYYIGDDGEPYLTFHGLSDHTVSTLTGAVAVGTGATIIEKPVRLWDTPQDNPDYGHSLILDSDGEDMSFAAYVRNVRAAERCM